jgi:hypothetical protein
VDDIPNQEVAALLRRALRLRFVRGITLTDYVLTGQSYGETRLEFKEKHPRGDHQHVTYYLRCKNGTQGMDVNVEKGFCDDLVAALGKKVFL